MPGSPTERNALQGLAGTITWNNQGAEDANSRRSTTRASRRVARHDQQDSRRATTRPTARIGVENIQGFLKISRFLEGILMEYIDMKES